jgi:hypothetical protein
MTTWLARSFFRARLRCEAEPPLRLHTHASSSTAAFALFTASLLSGTFAPRPSSFAITTVQLTTRLPRSRRSYRVARRARAACTVFWRPSRAMLDNGARTDA